MLEDDACIERENLMTHRFHATDSILWSLQQPLQPLYKKVGVTRYFAVLDINRHLALDQVFCEGYVYAPRLYVSTNTVRQQSKPMPFGDEEEWQPLAPCELP